MLETRRLEDLGAVLEREEPEEVTPGQLKPHPVGGFVLRHRALVLAETRLDIAR